MRARAFAIGATSSGAGKTILTLGILAALVRRGLRVQPFKCGPDFIDPSLHQVVTGVSSYNLDLRMMGPEQCRSLFFEKAETVDVVVLEGVMGLFDGGPASTAELAKLLGLPVYLVIDARSCAESAAAVLKGFETFDGDLHVAGAIFNRIGSDRHRELIERSVLQHCRTPVIGWMPRDDVFHLAQRHLGLHMGEEQSLDEEGVARLVTVVEQRLAVERLLVPVALPEMGQPKGHAASARKRRLVKIGVAEDRAFCFYYRQNFELLEKMGFVLVPFSPLQDRGLPSDLAMLYFGGGYPELYGAQLAANQSFRAAVRRLFDHGLPIYGECGGFMYLCRQLIDHQGQHHDMVGIFPFATVMGRRLRRLGYRDVTLTRTSLFGRTGDRLYGHEFHYSDLDDAGAGQEIVVDGWETCYRLDNNSLEGYTVGAALGSYVHLHFANTPEALDHLRQQLVG